MASIRRRNGKYQVQVRINGYTKSKTFPCHELAKKWANKQEIIAFTETDERPRYQPANFKEILMKYWEYAQHHHKGASVEQIVIHALCRGHWVNKPLPRLCRTDIIEFRDRRLLSVKPDTFKRQMNIIRSAARMASEEWGWICTMVLFQNIKLPKQDERQVRRVTPEMEKMLLDCADKGKSPLMRPLIILALETGMRRDELLNLRRDDLDLKNKIIYVGKTKNGKSRIIPMSSRAYSVFFSINKEINNRLIPMSGGAVNSCFQRIKGRTAMNWIRFHDLRHEAISRWFELGFTIAEIRSFAGHSNYEQTLHYAHASFDKFGNSRIGFLLTK